MKMQKLMYTESAILLSTSSGRIDAADGRSCTSKRGGGVFSRGIRDRWYKLATSNNVPADLFKSEPGKPTTPEMVDEYFVNGQIRPGNHYIMKRRG